jgi:hypothetical protein
MSSASSPLYIGFSFNFNGTLPAAIISANSIFLHLLQRQDRKTELWNTYVTLLVSRSAATYWCDLNSLQMFIYRCRTSTMVWFTSETLPLAQILDLYQSTNLCINPVTFFDYTKLRLGLYFLFFLRKVGMLSLSMGWWFSLSRMQYTSHGIESVVSISARNVATQIVLTLLAMWYIHRPRYGSVTYSSGTSTFNQQ